MKVSYTKCDICGSTQDVRTVELPVYRTTDGEDGLTHYKSPQILFEKLDVCYDCLKKATNIHDLRIMGFGNILIETNPELTKY